MFHWLTRPIIRLFRWAGRMMLYLGAMLCLLCIVLVGRSVFHSLDSMAGRAVATSLVVSGKTGMRLFPWWGLMIVGLVALWLWYRHKIVMSIIIGCITGSILALILLT